MTALSSMEYPHWLMIAGVLLLMLGFVGLALRQRGVEAEPPAIASDHAPSEPEADLNPVAVYNRTAKEKRRDRWAESFADEEPVDAIALLLAADAFPPAVFNSELPVAWVPTVELTVHVRGVPVPGPLRCSFVSRFIHDGLLDEEGAIWDSSGVLVAQSRQLALAPRPI